MKIQAALTLGIALALSSLAHADATHLDLQLRQSQVIASERAVPEAALAPASHVKRDVAICAAATVVVAGTMFLATELLSRSGGVADDARVTSNDLAGWAAVFAIFASL